MNLLKRNLRFLFATSIIAASFLTIFFTTQQAEAEFTGTETQITTNNAHQLFPDIYGNIIAWVDWRHNDWYNDIYTYDLATKIEKRVPAGFSRKFVVKVYKEYLVWYGDHNLFLHHLPSGVTKRLTNTFYVTDSFDIDDYKIVWSQRRATDMGIDLFLYDISSGVITQLTDDPAQKHRPAISNNKIVYQRSRFFNSSEVHIYDIITKEDRVLINTPWSQDAPDISGNYVVWRELISNSNAQPRIGIYNLSTGTLHYLFVTPNSSNSAPRIHGNTLVWIERVSSDSNLYSVAVYNLKDKERITLAKGTAYSSNVSAYNGNIVWTDMRNSSSNNYWDNLDVFLYQHASENQPPTLSFPTSGPYMGDGIDPNKGTIETEFTFKTVYTDTDNNMPQNISLITGDGIATTTRALVADASAPVELRDGNYANGEQFTATSTFPKKAKYFYHFEASDGKGGVARAPTTGELQFSVINVPVIIVPGIMGSYLNLDSTGEQIWPDLTDVEIPNILFPKKEIFLNDLGESINAISASGIIKETPKIPVIADAVDIFNGLINELHIQGYNDNTDIFFFPYDWRLDNTFNATENSKTSLSNLKSAINIIREATKSDTVNIIAHSMGGLLIKQYVAEQARIGEKSRIDKLIFVGVPHLGAPKSAAILLEGFHPILGSSILEFDSIKKFSRNMIPIYQLLPSRAYIESKMEKYIYIHPGLLNKIYHYFSDTGWLNYDQTKQFINTELREDKTMLFESSEAFHRETDNLNIPALGIKTYNIEGCGKGSIGGIKYKLKYIFTYGVPALPYVSHDLKYVNGDGTVPFLSANSIQSNQFFHIQNTSHMQLPSSDGVPNLIATILQDKLSSFNYPSHISTTLIGDNGDFCDFSGIALSVHSPIELHIYDSQNNHAGPTGNGHIENNIPDAQYNLIGDEKFIFLPNETTYRILGIATNTGAFDLRITEIEKSKIATTTYFDRIPIITADLRFAFNIAPRQHLRALQIDQNGDSLFESEITPTSILTAKESDDLLPPETSIFIDGSKGKNDWYVSDVKIGFSATDDNSGILKTEYSLDNGQTWNIYQQPFTIAAEGATTILYLSTDRAGNYELMKSQKIKIDKTPPEAKIFFDQNLKQLRVEGIDNLSSVAAVQNGNNYTLTDEAGHTLVVAFDKLKTEGKEIKAEISALRYDGVPTPVIPENRLQYEWSLEKNGDIKELNQRIEIEKNFDVHAHYDAKKDETKVDAKIEDKEDGKKIQQTIPGLTTLILTTNFGNFFVDY